MIFRGSVKYHGYARAGRSLHSASPRSQVLASQSVIETDHGSICRGPIVALRLGPTVRAGWDLLAARGSGLAETSGDCSHSSEPEGTVGRAHYG